MIGEAKVTLPQAYCISVPVQICVSFLSATDGKIKECVYINFV
jgi:hypothetical protein